MLPLFHKVNISCVNVKSAHRNIYVFSRYLILICTIFNLGFRFANTENLLFSYKFMKKKAEVIFYKLGS